MLGTTNRRQCAANRGPLLPRPAQNTLASALYIMDLSLWTIICCGAGFLFHIYIVASGGCRKERERSFECDVVALLKNVGLIDWRDPVRNRRCRSQGERASREDETLRVCDRCEWIVHLCARSLNGHLNGKGKREMRSCGFPFCGIKWCGRVRAYYYKKTQAAVRVGGCGIKAGNNWPITKLLATPGQWLSREKSSTAKRKRKTTVLLSSFYFLFFLFLKDRILLCLFGWRQKLHVELVSTSIWKKKNVAICHRLVCVVFKDRYRHFKWHWNNM